MSGFSPLICVFHSFSNESLQAFNNNTIFYNNKCILSSQKAIKLPLRVVSVMCLKPKCMHAVRWSTDDEKVEGVGSLLRKFGGKNKEQRVSRTYVAQSDCNGVSGEEEEMEDAERKNHQERCLNLQQQHTAFHPPRAPARAQLGCLTWILLCPFPVVLRRLREGPELTRGQSPCSQPLGVLTP